MKNERHAFQARIRRLGDDPVRAIPEYLTHLERDPDDWTAVNGLAELYLRIGENEAALALLGRLGEHLQQEGFLAKAAAVFKRVLRIRPDDLALLNLADIAAQEGRLIEAKQYLLQLERERRDRGDIAGADQCVASLDALIRVNTAAPAPDVQLEPAARGGVATVEPPPDEAGAPSVQDGEPTSVDALLDAGVAPSEEASAGFAQSAAGPRPDTENGPGDSGTVEQPRTSRPARPLPRAGKQSRRSSSSRPAKSLQSVFNELREQARQSDAEAAAHEHFDRAQYHLQDGNETAAMAELKMAAEAPALRFAAAAQLGRLHIGRGEMSDGITWLERASQSPPVSPDEGLAVLYELADALQRQGERERALAALTALEGRRRGYRDVNARMAALSAPSTDTPT